MTTLTQEKLDKLELKMRRMINIAGGTKRGLDRIPKSRHRRKRWARSKVAVEISIARVAKYAERLRRQESVKDSNRGDKED